MSKFLCISFFAICSVTAAAQSQTGRIIPDAPAPRTLQQANLPTVQTNTTPVATSLTRQQAEQIAIANNPSVRISTLLSKIQHQVVRERRADELPYATGNLTAVQAKDASRISSGTLTASSLFEHAGMGVQLNQLLTDFGRTHSMILAAKLQEKSQNANAEATRQQIVLVTDESFYGALEADATLRVAVQTVATRQALVDQVSALTSAKLKSDLDLSFAQVNLLQAKLLQIDAQNNVEAAKATLLAVLGSEAQTNYQLIAEEDSLPPLPPDESELIATALTQRPDLQALQWNEKASISFEHAQRDQLLPSINAMGIVGKTPVGASPYFTTDWYGAVGVNMNVPLFNGFRTTAQIAEAKEARKIASEQTVRLRIGITQGVRNAWLSASTAFERVSVSEELLKQANLALDLAQTRYKLGLSSIVELSQAQLQQTQAAIGAANARTQYQFALASLRYEIGV